MDPVWALIWCLLDLVLNMPHKNIFGRSGLISTDTGSIGPKDCTISSFFCKVAVAIRAKVGTQPNTLASTLSFP